MAKRLATFRRHVPLRGRRLLDVGCGNGAYTTVLAEGFEEVWAVDVVTEHLEAFRATIRGSPLAHRIHIREMSADRLDLPSDYFDAVTAIEVIEHIGHLGSALDEMYRVLVPGGTLCVACPNQLFPLETHTVVVPGSGKEYPGRLMPFLPYVPPLHRRLATARNFTARRLRRLMERHGFRQIAIDYIMPPFDRWRLGRRLIRPITDRLERSPLRFLGVSIIGIYRKPPAGMAMNRGQQQPHPEPRVVAEP